MRVIKSYSLSPENARWVEEQAAARSNDYVKYSRSAIIEEAVEELRKNAKRASEAK